MKIQCAHTEIVDIKALKPHPKNNNTHTEQQLKLLAKIMKHQGWRNPIVVSKQSGFIVAGHARRLASMINEWSECPVDYQDFKSDQDEYAHMTADNEIAHLAKTDLSKVLNDILEFGPDFDFDLLGIPDFKLPEDFEAKCDEDEVPEHVEPKSKLGDIYQIGRHRLMCGDSTSIDAVEKLMNGEKADMVFTDPPYGVNYDGGHANKKRRNKLANDHDTTIYHGVMPMISIASKDNAALYLWFAATKSLQVLQVLQVLQDNNYEIRNWLIWNKNMAQFGAIGAQYKQKHEPCLYSYKKGNSPFWDGPTNEVSVWDEKRAAKNEFHPTQKPVELSERAMNNSCPTGGGVLDLFGGSGSTLIACEKTNRKCFMMELDPHYCDVIVARWEKYTGKQAELICNM